MRSSVPGKIDAPLRGFTAVGAPVRDYCVRINPPKPPLRCAVPVRHSWTPVLLYATKGSKSPQCALRDERHAAAATAQT